MPLTLWSLSLWWTKCAVSRAATVSLPHWSSRAQKPDTFSPQGSVPRCRSVLTRAGDASSHVTSWSFHLRSKKTYILIMSRVLSKKKEICSPTISCHRIWFSPTQEKSTNRTWRSWNLSNFVVWQISNQIKLDTEPFIFNVSCTRFIQTAFDWGFICNEKN